MSRYLHYVGDSPSLEQIGLSALGTAETLAAGWASTMLGGPPAKGPAQVITKKNNDLGPVNTTRQVLPDGTVVDTASKGASAVLAIAVIALTLIYITKK